MLLLLPSEIIHHIGTFLSQSDYYQLILVNRACYDTFIIPLHRQAEFDELQLGEFLQVTKHHQYIQELRLNLTHLSSYSKPTFETAFPIWASMGYGRRHICNSFELAPFRDLKALTLVDCCDYPSPLDIVAVTPNITSLNIEVMDEENISIEMLDGILQACSHLEHLDIAADVADVPKIEKLDTTQRFGQLKTLALRLPRTKSHHELFNRGYQGFRNLQLWLQYVASRFPNLESLTFQAHSIYMEEPYPDTFCNWFHSQCPHLVRFEWYNVLPDDVFIQKLSDQQRQSQIFRLTEPYMFATYLREAVPSRYIYLSTISNLEVSVPDQMNCNQVLYTLGKTCPQLRQLELNGKTLDEDELLSIDLVFDQLPHLTTLVLHDFVVQSDHTQAEKREYPLHKIEFYSCTLYDSVFDYLTPRCLNLSYLSLVNTTHKDQDYKMKIHLPYQNLIKVYMEDIHIGDEVTRLYRLQQKKSKPCWYFIDDYHGIRLKYVIYERKAEKVDTEDFDTMMAQFLQSRLESGHQSSNQTDLLPLNDSQGWDLDKLIEKGYVDFQCESVRSFNASDNS